MITMKEYGQKQEKGNKAKKESPLYTAPRYPTPKRNDSGSSSGNNSYRSDGGCDGVVVLPLVILIFKW